MFFNKNKIKENPVNTICNTDKNLTECEIVSKLKQYQKELKEIEMLDLDTIIDKCFKNDRFDYYREGYYYLKSVLITLFQDNTIDFEERFKEFGKELNRCKNQSYMIDQLENNIKIEKEKLGIE